MTLITELNNISNQIQEKIDIIEDGNFEDILKKLTDAANEVGKAWSRSCLGYHSRVYYENFLPPPPGANFITEWGLKPPIFNDGSKGNWKEYSNEEVKQEIYNQADNIDLETIRKISKEITSYFEDQKSNILSIVSTFLSSVDDSYILSLKEEVENLNIQTFTQIQKQLKPIGEIFTRDSLAGSQGILLPIHVVILSEALSLSFPFNKIKELSKLTHKIISHIERNSKYSLTNNNVNNNKIFIVHGRDSLKDEIARFIEKLDLNAIILGEQPDNGRTIIEKFEEEALNVGFAIVLLTPDDVGGLKDSEKTQERARQNVIFELGYFYGKLGRNKVCLIKKGNIEIASDLQGIIYESINDPDWKFSLAREIKHAGLEVDLNKLV